jgi:hypothetical protein
LLDLTPIPLLFWGSGRPNGKKYDKIGRMRKPGLSEGEFYGLFAKCDIFQAITTRDVFRYHLEACPKETAAEDTVTEEESE